MEMEAFWQKLEGRSQKIVLGQSGPIPTAVQASRLEGVLLLLNEMRETVLLGLPPEILSEKNRNIMVQIENVVGKVDVDEVLGRIFSDFCIGK